MSAGADPESGTKIESLGLESPNAQIYSFHPKHPNSENAPTQAKRERVGIFFGGPTFQMDKAIFSTLRAQICTIFLG